MSQNKLKMIFGIGAIISAVVSIALFLIAFLAVGDQAFLKTTMIIVAAVCAVLCAEFAWMFWAEKDDKQNFFLYNPQTGRNMPVQKLSFQVVNGRMNRFLSAYASGESKLWTDRVFDNPYLEMADHYKPAVAYKLFFDLAERDAEIGWRCFEAASEETVDFLCAALDQNEDYEMAKTIRMMKKSKPMNLKQVRDYLVNNRNYLKGKLFRYVHDHIQLF